MWLGRVLCVVFAVCACSVAGDPESRLVRTSQGPVRGYRAPEGDLFVFYSIPYATAPTGKDRFKAPLPGPVWMTPLEAVDRNIVCPQPDPMNLTTNKNMQEDCLIANVYVPDTEETNLPVVVIVHGGAYQVGFGDLVTPKHLVRSKKVIIVTFNYRLSVHGFLCLGTTDAPGNAGMKDQVAALRWVNKNIANFGGNPNDVTLSGYSAGSSAVDLLLLSKTTKGLFHRAIPESGANVGPWSVQIDPIANAKEFATTLGFDNVNDIDALEEFYKSATYEMITSDPFMARKDSTFVFSPCIERDTGVEMFLEDSPVSILQKRDYNKVPMLYGFADMEGLFRVNMGYEEFKNGMNEKFSDYLPIDLQFSSKEEKEKVAKIVKEFYFGDDEVGDKTILQYINFYSDIIFAYPTLRSVKLQVEAGNDKIYLYEYDFDTDAPMPPGVEAKVQGASHCAQTMAVLDGGNLIPGNNGEDDLPEDLKKMKAIIRKFWLNFMTTGEPVPAGSDLPAWPPANAFGAPYMSLSLTPQLKQEELLSRRMRFWDNIYEQYYRTPVPPPKPATRHSEL